MSAWIGLRFLRSSGFCTRVLAAVLLAIPACAADGAARPQPRIVQISHENAAWLGTAGARLAGAHVEQTDEGLVLTARLTASAQADLAPARKVWVEAVNSAGQVTWSRAVKLETAPVKRHGRLPHEARFRVDLPAGEWSELRIDLNRG